MNHPTERVIVTEVGMRDGLQSISRIMSTDDKKRWIDTTFEAGIRHMEVASFVRAKLLPQMADAGAVIAYALTHDSLVVTALVPNVKGAQRAIDSGVQRIVVPISVCAAHSLANVRKTPAEDQRVCRDMFRSPRPRRNYRGSIHCIWLHVARQRAL